MRGRLSASSWAFAGVVGLSLLVAACDPGAEGAAPENAEAEPVHVEIMVVAAAEVSGAVRASGLVAYKRETGLSFAASGEVESISVDQGDTVRGGQTLATLRRTAVGADEAEAALARKTAEQAYDRVKRLHEAGAASSADLDNARLALERVRERVALTAPASGVVLRRAAERGQVVSAGQALLWIGETAAGLIIRATVSAEESGRIAPGDGATISTRGGASLPGKVLRVSPQSVAGTGAFEIEIDVENTTALRSGEVAEVIIQPRESASDAGSRFVIPAIALVDARADQGVVFLAGGEGKAQRRAVATGGVVDEGVIILEGLAPGDRVITRGASMVRDGDSITIAGE
jgi:RND family efflux transporter MFP subunit